MDSFSPLLFTHRSTQLPVFPWDQLAEPIRLAQSYPEGMIDLSVGSPVDPPAEIIQHALAQASSIPSYPPTAGTPKLRQAIISALQRRHHITSLSEDAVLPVIGTKECIAWLPSILGITSTDTVIIPELAYPTYEVGIRFAGARMLRSDIPTQVHPSSVRMIYLNSPSNPTGRILSIEELGEIVSWARTHKIIIVSDECYLDLGWSSTPVSILHPQVCQGSHQGLLAIHSLSKTSSLAGYRAGFVAGDPHLVQELLTIRKHMGMMVPHVIQAAMIAALNDDTHIYRHKSLYQHRRDILIPALHQAGFQISFSEGGLYLWVTNNHPCSESVMMLAHQGILTAPGEFYGPTGAYNIRISLTATDDDITRAAQRLTHLV